MNKQTANHLNALLKKRDFKATVPTEAYQLFHPATAAKFRDAINSALPEALAREIQAAARERREAHLANPLGEDAKYYASSPILHIAAEIARPQMQAIAGAYNATTEAEYEAYRIACEQRIAVPPPCA
jgi:hypothetical protein